MLNIICARHTNIDRKIITPKKEKGEENISWRKHKNYITLPLFRNAMACLAWTLVEAMNYFSTGAYVGINVKRVPSCYCDSE